MAQFGFPVLTENMGLQSAGSAFLFCEVSVLKDAKSENFSSIFEIHHYCNFNSDF